MRDKKISSNTRITLISGIILTAILVSACGTLQVGIYTTATPAPTENPGPLVYDNPDYGFSFNYPSDSELEQEPGLLKLNQEEWTLFISYRGSGEPFDLNLGRTGMSAGELIYGDKIQFLDGVVPAYYLLYEKKYKAAYYGEKFIQAGNLAFKIWLENTGEQDYAQIDLSTERLETISEILASFQVRDSGLSVSLEEATQPDTAGESLRYHNPIHGFTFTYPPGWSLEEEPNLISLHKDTYTLKIGFNLPGERIDTLPQSGLPAGQLVTFDEIEFLGGRVQVTFLIFEDRVKTISYHIPGGSRLIERGDLEFSIWIEDLESEYSQIDIPTEIQAEANLILSSFAWAAVEQQSSNRAAIVVGWYGSVSSQPGLDPRFDSVLNLLPEGTGSVGLIPGSAQLEQQISQIQDKGPPNKHAHFWGTLVCDQEEDLLCVLTVNQMRTDGPGEFFPPDEVKGWIGRIITNPDWAQIDDAFQVADSNFPVLYGIWSEDPEIAAEIERLRNNGQIVKLYGEVLCGVIDANGCQINVRTIEY